MNKKITSIGVVVNASSNQKNKDFSKDSDIQPSTPLLPEIVCTLSESDFIHIEQIAHIYCQFEIFQNHKFSAYIQSISKLKGKHHLYAINLRIDSKYANKLKAGMISTVNIELLEKNNHIIKESA